MQNPLLQVIFDIQTCYKIFHILSFYLLLLSCCIFFPSLTVQQRIPHPTPFCLFFLGRSGSDHLRCFVQCKYLGKKTSWMLQFIPQLICKHHERLLPAAALLLSGCAGSLWVSLVIALEQRCQPSWHGNQTRNIPVYISCAFFCSRSDSGKCLGKSSLSINLIFLRVFILNNVNQ